MVATLTYARLAQNRVAAVAARPSVTPTPKSLSESVAIPRDKKDTWYWHVFEPECNLL